MDAKVAPDRTAVKTEVNRQAWDEPRIVLERLLEAKAQGLLPGSDGPSPLAGFLGPLSTSAGWFVPDGRGDRRMQRPGAWRGKVRPRSKVCR